MYFAFVGGSWCGPPRPTTAVVDKVTSIKRGRVVCSAESRAAFVPLRSDGAGPFGPGAAPGPEVVQDANGEPRINVVFVHPQIHWNTGNIGRTCLGLGARLHLIEPLGFSLDEKQVRRAGLDYWEHVDLQVHTSWEAFAEKVLPTLGERYYFTKYGSRSMLEPEIFDMADTNSGKLALIFGSETDGLTGIEPWMDEHVNAGECVAFPMRETEIFRSFNLSTTASMAMWEAYKSMSTNAKARKPPAQ